jgi:hypothetical protein
MLHSSDNEKKYLVQVRGPVTKYIPKMVTKQYSPQTSNTNIRQNMSGRFNLDVVNWNILRITCKRILK